jgi:hypothetical protein
MNPRKRIILLICIMVTTCIIAESIAIGLLYRTALREEAARLEETAKSHARLIEAIARFDAIYSNDYPDGATEATLSQIVDAHDRFQGFGETGEFTLSRRVGDQIIFLLSHRHDDHETPHPIPFDSGLAEPMRLALLGQSGTIVGLDYRGERVFAAYEPVRELDMGIVAKIDMREIRAPFVKASVISGLVAVIAVVLGAVSFIRVTNPLLKRLSETVERLQDALKKVKTLRGLLPICASCKKIRDDRGHWQEMEIYISERSEADFSHGICQECLEKIHPDRGRFGANH